MRVQHKCSGTAEPTSREHAQTGTYPVIASVKENVRTIFFVTNGINLIIGGISIVFFDYFRPHVFYQNTQSPRIFHLNILLFI